MLFLGPYSLAAPSGPTNVPLLSHRFGLRGEGSRGLPPGLELVVPVVGITKLLGERRVRLRGLSSWSWPKPRGVQRGE